MGRAQQHGQGHAASPPELSGCPKSPTAGLTNRARAAGRDDDTQAVSQCLRELVRHVRNPADHQRQDREPHSEHRVLLDIVVDDVRCVLIQSPAHSSRVPLSPREREIVRMIAAGHPNKVVAAVLDISCWTVSTHLRRIFAKLGVTSRAAMVARLVGEPDGPSLDPHVSGVTKR